MKSITKYVLLFTLVLSVLSSCGQAADSDTATTPLAENTTVSVDTTVASTAEEPKTPQSTDDIHIPSRNAYWAEAEELFTFHAPEQERWTQGGCFDGEKFVLCMNAFTDGVENTRIVELDKDGNFIRQSEILFLDHANNLTFVAKKNAYLVSHCQNSEGVYNRYSLVDADTLTVIETADLVNPFFSMGYDPITDRFASAQFSGSPMDIWDGDLNLLQTDNVGTFGSVSQGICCDSEGVYFVRSGSDDVQSEILHYSWDARRLASLPLSELPATVEPENISIVNGKTYVIGNAPGVGGIVYLIHFIPR